MALLNDETGAVLAYFGAVRGDVYGMTAAGLRQNPRGNQGPNHSSGNDFCPTLFNTPTGQETVSQLTFSLFVLILFSSEMLKKRHGGGILDCELLVLGRGENSASPLLINRLNSQ